MRFAKTKLLFLGAGALAIPLTATAPALASGLHFFHNQNPVITVNGNTVEATGQVAGAGTFIVADLTVNFTFPVSCFNPGNDTGPVPGQSGSGSLTTPPQTIQAVHGNASFDLTATVNPTASSNACPNKSWTAVAGPATITSATVNINSSNGGALTYTKTF
ncbi:hypothetical protein [Yinghuangia seranimata]|uniref:hypothetical protein n=1 Tax=Yinghuangia seranimata TaxID=408067 RepID=UPI00248CDF1E|nr:hypothetical protein [Yinghuangia seranimata]MDI2132937.1 hypothetical protein [Yinghuangia seranimata]